MIKLLNTSNSKRNFYFWNKKQQKNSKNKQN
nr:MAG TPA: hypothetical protein [Caudoviricetes sp.]